MKITDLKLLVECASRHGEVVQVTSGLISAKVRLLRLGFIEEHRIWEHAVRITVAGDKFVASLLNIEP